MHIIYSIEAFMFIIGLIVGGFYLMKNGQQPDPALRSGNTKTALWWLLIPIVLIIVTVLVSKL